MVKSYKKIVALTLIATVLCSSISCPADPTFILKNGSSVGTIQVDVMQNGKSLSGGLQSIAKGDEFALDLSLNNPTTMELHYCQTAASCKTELPQKLIAQFTKNKTIYIKFDGRKIEPQRGSFGQTTGKYSGLNINNNINQNNISITHTQTPKSALGVSMTAQEAVEAAWQQFPQANNFRKTKDTSLNQTDMEFNKLTQKEQQNVVTLARLVLGVSTTDSKTDITKKYRQLSLKYHPDKYAGDKLVGAEVSKIINTAKARLSN